MTKPSDDPATGRAPSSGTDWISDSLKRLYNDTASEPIPAEMLELLGLIEAGSKDEDKSAPPKTPQGDRP